MFINTTASLTCVAYGLPFPSITWNKSGTAVSNSSLTSIYEETKSENGVSFVRSVLEICGSDLTDSGEYSCTADNGITSDSSNFMITVVTVQGKNTLNYPSTNASSFSLFGTSSSEIIVYPELVTHVDAGTTTVLTCLAHGYPLPSFTWTRAGSDLSNDSRITVLEEQVTEGTYCFCKIYPTNLQCNTVRQ